MYKPGEYSEAFYTYLNAAGITGFDWWLTVQNVGTAEALRLVEESIKDPEA